MIRYICKQFKFSYTYPMRVISPTEMRAVKILEMLPICHFLDRSQICDFLVKYDINIIKLFTKSQICLYTQLFRKIEIVCIMFSFWYKRKLIEINTLFILYEEPFNRRRNIKAFTTHGIRSIVIEKVYSEYFFSSLYNILINDDIIVSNQ